MAWSFGWGCVMEVSCHKRCDRIKISSCSKAVSTKHYRSIFYNRSYATLTSLYKWKILEKEEKKTTINLSILYCIVLMYCICFQRKILLDWSKCNYDLWTLWFAQVLCQSKFCFSLVDYILLISRVLWSMNLLFFFHWQTKSKQNNHSNGNTQWNHFMECKLQYLCGTSRTDAI